MGPPLILATLNARYAHASFGLRYLLANLGDLRAQAALLELEITTPRLEAVERILALAPRVLGLGVYIWNVAETTAIVADLKRLRPELVIVLGGPEVSYEPETQEIVRLADYVVTGEADLAFAELARAVLAGERPAQKIIAAPVPSLERIALPYGEYSDEDLAHRVVYVEASRGCPYSCEFCLSALDVPVRAFALAPFLAALERLIERGARDFKFVDRTFNLSPKTACAILEFFLERMRPGLHVHFEMVPDRLPSAVRELAARFPDGSIQFEIGIQTFTAGVNELVSRRQDDAKAIENLRFLRDETRVHVHADLLFGLPGETLESFGASFDRLLPLVPGDIQIGVLKRLRGTPIVRHELAGRLRFSPTPPYEVLTTDTVTFEEMQRIKRFSRVFETFRNSGDHARAIALLESRGASLFREHLAFAEWLFARVGRTWALAMPLRCELLFRWLTEERAVAHRLAAEATIDDFYRRTPRSERLPFIEPHVDREALFELQRANRARSHARAVT